MSGFLFFRPGPTLFKFDHVFPAGKDAPVTVILYAQLGTEGFKEFHDKLVELAVKGEVVYVYRHYMQVNVVVVRSLPLSTYLKEEDFI